MENFFRSDDINLTSFLLSQGTLLHEIFQDRPRHFVFILTPKKLCDDLKTRYTNNALTPVLDFISKREMLMTEIKQRI